MKENKGGKFAIIKAMIPLLPLTFPGYRYCGPGNGPPTNELDTIICMELDYCCSSNIPKS